MRDAAKPPWRVAAAAPRNRAGPVIALGAIERASVEAAKPRDMLRVTVRRAKEADYEGVAGIRGVIIPVGMSGATGFLGGKVVIDDPAEAKKRVLMAKVRNMMMCFPCL